ncbi:hypothetical protein J7E91_09295 [Streptomyces sp. ISL-99]|uniref:hypothetical protein n=1 Tax=Streptomyces sp. ISL-99 TaxID=2819193 RepID=UPI001BE7DE50|nr:hypothetical protein [Streptomyces sp. ISL-99]MBT2525624.1 hypothetical protein [Streptomyces sp. ISL-99]
MTEQKRGPEDIPTAERMATLAAAKGSAIKHKLLGEEQTERGRQYTADAEDVRTLVTQWPSAPKKVELQILEQCGPPNEATPARLIWHRNGPWKRTELTRDEIVHNFPTAHTDFLTQYIDYAVPPEKAGEITQFDGSCLVDRTAGEAAARCDSEAMNILTLNLMHDIVTGAKDVSQAREVYAENASAHVLGRSAPYTERLQFSLPQQDTADPDESIIGGPMGRQTAGKVKDILVGNEQE